MFFFSRISLFGFLVLALKLWLLSEGQRGAAFALLGHASGAVLFPPLPVQEKEGVCALIWKLLGHR